MLWVNLVGDHPHGGGRRARAMVSTLPSSRTGARPEWLVWPTIATGFGLLVDLGPASDVAINVFKFLMAIYAIQGLSILSFFFDLWNVGGFSARSVTWSVFS